MATTSKSESEGLLQGADQGFGTMASGDDVLTSLRQKPGSSRHQRETSTATEISWLSFLRRGNSAQGSQGSDTSRRKKTKWEKKHQRVRGILFDKSDYLVANMLLAVCYVLFILYSVLIFVGPFVLNFFVDKDDWCYSRLTEEQRDMFLPASSTVVEDDETTRLLGSGDFTATAEQPYPNPDYDTDPCRYVRFHFMSYLTLEECDICRRLFTAVLLGGAIGYERRSSDRPAGIRTMGLVSLGACFYTISSVMAFKSSTQTWDASRVAAALPSGVGFLGAALIWKGSFFVGDHEMHQVHGLNTAASLWLSAAVGVGVGGALYLVTIYVTSLVIMILRLREERKLKNMAAQLRRSMKNIPTFGS
ncbi:Protein MgtC [Seminavis robusta]|uniref:Protein MgtC n=1 Tax=Seminavis robusta TaxID=568900 RepID=A0A9N8DL70_9STRA|nr:Protein MgtC [Seminavis robusta]|eukprot:Sro140_g065540.1 Protein MgtC (362) ;mRNA; r:74694-76217